MKKGMVMVGSFPAWLLHKQDVIELLLRINIWWLFTSIWHFVGEFTLTFRLGSWAHSWSKPPSRPHLLCALVNVSSLGAYGLDSSWGKHVVWPSTHQRQIFCSIDLRCPTRLVTVNIAQVRLRLQSWKPSWYFPEGQSWRTELKFKDR